jgi:glutamine synthetase
MYREASLHPELSDDALTRLEAMRAAGVERVRVHYVDFLGTTRAKVVPLSLLEEAASDGLNFCLAVFAINHVGVMPDGTGLRDEIHFRDMNVIADLQTLRLLPWERSTAICLADCWLDGEPLPSAPRGILRRAIAEAEAHGYRVACAHELEFFLLRRVEGGRYEPYAPAPGLVYRLDPRVDPEGVVRAMEDAVRGLGLPFICANQEYDPSQWEINCRHTDALQAADDAHLLKLAIKEIAAMHGLSATFIGRPVDGGGTSGYHLHLSLWDAAGGNAFEDAGAPHRLSDLARWFAAGVLEHARGMTAVTAPTVNAYKRFIAQELAPYFLDWGEDNRSVCVRVPIERGSATRLELRAADGSANAYLAAAVAIFAGVDGIERKLDPGPPSLGIYDPPVERPTMPFSLGEALDALEADGFMREKLGDQFLQAFLTIKRDEFRRFSLAVTDWELREYLEAL